MTLSLSKRPLLMYLYTFLVNQVTILNSPKAQLPKERVERIVTWLTRKVYRYINRGLFERDKVMFKLMMATKILIKDGKLTNGDVGLLLKAGGGIDDRTKPFSWME
jgi:dynein heavy chain